MIVKSFEKTHGGVAQLGERYTGSVEVMGSNPTVSTLSKALKHYVSGLFLTHRKLRFPIS